MEPIGKTATGSAGKAKPDRWHFRFGIRALLIFVFVTALIIGPLTQLQRARHQEQQVTIIQLIGGSLEYEHQWTGGTFDETAPDPGPAWLKPWTSRHVFIEPRSAEVELDKTTQHDVVLNAISSLNGLASLDLRFPESPTLDTSQLGRLSHLSELRLSAEHPNEAVPVSQIGFVSQLSKLEALDIIMQRQELPDLEKLQNLRSLRCVAASDSRELSKLKSLEKLDISGFSYPAGFLDVKHIVGLSKLEELDCSYCSGRNFNEFANCSSLRKLDVTRFKAPELKGVIIDLGPLARLPNLEELSFGEKFSDLDAVDLGPLHSLSNLRKLNCVCNVSNLGALAALPNFESLSFEEVDSLDPIKELKSLKSLSMNFQKELDYTALSECPSLVELQIEVNEEDGDSFLKALSAPGIQKLVIKGSFTIDTTDFPVMNELESIELNTLGSIEGLLKQPKLREVVLFNCGERTKEKLPQLLDIPTFEVVRSRWLDHIHFQREESGASSK